MKFILLVLILIKNVMSANILFVSPLASPSHHVWNKILTTELLKNGHNITMLTHETEKEPPPKNYTVITMEGFYEYMHEHYDMEGLIQETNVLYTILSLFEFMDMTCEYDMKPKSLESLLNYPKDFKFDLIIFDVTTNQCLYPLIERFGNPPIVGVTAFLLPPALSYAFGNHIYTSYMPYYSTMYTNKMSFFERICNFVYTNFEIFYREYISKPKQFEMAKKRFGDDIASLDELERRISVLLSNTDPVLEYPLALPPNIIPIGGMHVKPPKALPADLQKIAEEAKDGLILFSLGTNIRSANFRPHQIKALLDAFEKLPQTILWKFEEDDLKGLPPNVIIRKWLPQNDILGHPNTRLFISHTGGLSTQETIYHGVPIVGMPFIIDQFNNIEKMSKRNLGVFLDHKTLTTDKVYKAVTEVLNNPIYRQNIQDISKIYRDQPQTALERAIFWIEYVLRHGGAEHLNLPSRDMPAYQILNLDVAAVFLLGLIMIYLVVRFIVNSFCGAFSSRKSDLRKKKLK